MKSATTASRLGPRHWGQSAAGTKEVQASRMTKERIPDTYGQRVGDHPADSPRVINQPGGAYGDSMGGMTIAGGIAAALFARERTGEAVVVDVSLMSVGAWAFALSLDERSLLTDEEQAPPSDRLADEHRGQPDHRQLQTSDGALDQLHHAAAGPVLRRCLPAPRSRAPDRRRALRHGGEADGQRARGRQVRR